MKSKTVKILSFFVFVILFFVIIAVLQRLVLYKTHPKKYSDLVIKYSNENNLDKDLVFALIKKESNFNENAKSNKNAYGLMQITIETFWWALSKDNQKLDDEMIKNPEINVKYGCLILKYLIDDFGNEETALAAYNAGRARVKSWLKDERYSTDGKTFKSIPFNETEMYVKNIENAKKIYQKLYS